MDIKIIGAGFAGLAAAYYLAKSGSNVTVIASPQEKGASEIAAGLVHRFGGAHAKPNWQGIEAMQAFEELLAVAQEATPLPIVLHRGALRLALTEEQQTDFKYNASHIPENEWHESHQIPGVTQAPGLWIPHAYTIQSGHYLTGLKTACHSLGVRFESEHITTIPAGMTILATGAATLQFFPMEGFSVTKGQLLRLKWPDKLPPLPYALNSKAYIVMDSDQKSCWVGSTYERTFTHTQADVATARDDIMPKVLTMIPELGNAEILECQAGLRMSTPNHQPRIIAFNDTCWGLVGFGSKGLLYHSLFGAQISQMLS